MSWPEAEAAIREAKGVAIGMVGSVLMPDLAAADTVFPELLLKYTPTVFAELIIAGALYWKHSTKAGALWSIIIGEAIMISFTFIFKISPLGFGPGLWAMCIALVVFIVVSLLTKPEEHTEEVIDSINEFFA